MFEHHLCISNTHKLLLFFRYRRVFFYTLSVKLLINLPNLSTIGDTFKMYLKVETVLSFFLLNISCISLIPIKCPSLSLLSFCYCLVFNFIYGLYFLPLISIIVSLSSPYHIDDYQLTLIFSST